MPELTKHFRVIRYDLRGHGKSAAPEGPYSLDQLGLDALAILDALGVQKANWMACRRAAASASGCSSTPRPDRTRGAGQYGGEIRFARHLERAPAGRPRARLGGPSTARSTAGSPRASRSSRPTPSPVSAKVSSRPGARLGGLRFGAARRRPARSLCARCARLCWSWRASTTRHAAGRRPRDRRHSWRAICRTRRRPSLQCREHGSLQPRGHRFPAGAAAKAARPASFPHRRPKKAAKKAVKRLAARPAKAAAKKAGKNDPPRTPPRRLRKRRRKGREDNSRKGCKESGEEGREEVCREIGEEAGRQGDEEIRAEEDGGEKGREESDEKGGEEGRKRTEAALPFPAWREKERVGRQALRLRPGATALFERTPGVFRLDRRQHVEDVPRSLWTARRSWPAADTCCAGGGRRCG